MSDEIAAVEVVRRIWVDQHSLEIGEWTEAPDMVELRTVGKANVEYFGSINLAMAPATARLIGVALIDSANEIEKRKP